MDSIVTAVRAADGIWTTDIPRLRAQAVIATLAIDSTNRVYGRKVKDVKSHGPNIRKSLNY